MTERFLVELDGVGRSFDTPGGSVTALSPVSLKVASGDFIAVVGPSGSGKTTMLNILGLLDVPTIGTYRLDGLDVGELTDTERARKRAADFGFVFQAFHLLDYRTVEENVQMALLYDDRPDAGKEDDAERLLTRLGLGHRRHALPPTLSGGEKQRVAICRALMGEPSVLLCDEPTGNLDQSASESVVHVLQELNAQGLTIILITHDGEIASAASECFSIDQLCTGRT